MRLRNREYDLEEHFEILDNLGQGSYSTVKLAHDNKLGHKVAIKCCKGKNSIKMLENEYEILKDIDDDNVIKVKTLLHDGQNEAYLVMEYFEGDNLNDFVKKNGKLTENDSKSIIKRLLRTLETLHWLEITHCDIKPENILIKDVITMNEELSDLWSPNDSLRAYEMKLIDFNISKCKPSDVLTVSSTDSKFSQSFMTTLSSPLYSPPETKNRKGCYTESVDIWGAGVVLFTLLLGTLDQHKLNKFIEVDERHKSMLEIVQDNKDISEQAKTLLTSLLNKDSEQRPTATEALAHDWLIY